MIVPNTREGMISPIPVSIVADVVAAIPLKCCGNGAVPPIGGTAPLPQHLSGIAATTSATILTGIGLIIPSLVFGTIIVALFALDKDGHQLT